jgi:hypothetical protein
MGGKSARAPDYAPLAASSREAAQIMGQLGREQLGFARAQYADLAPIVRGLADQQSQAQEEQMRQARDYYGELEQVYRPLERGLVREAQEFNTEAAREQLARQAAADASRAFGTTRAASERASASMGINPNSGRFAGMGIQTDLGLTANRAAAMTGARERAENLGYARRLDVAGLGRNLPGVSTAAYGGATGAGSAAAGTYMAPGNQFMTGMNQGAGTIGSGLNMRQQGYGNILNTQGSVYGQQLNAQGEIIGSIAGAGIGLMSDIRLKTNIELIGIDSHTKLPTYEFAYKAAPTIRYRGVMAQDVEKVYPQAVVEGTDGYKRVRYDMLGMSMEPVRS